MTALDSVYRRDPSIVSRDIAGETIRAPIRQHVADLESIYTLNETAARVWALVDGQHSLSEIRDTLVAEFEVDPEEAERDLDELVGQLESIGAVTKV